MAIESDIDKALGSQDSEPSVGSELEVTSTSLLSPFLSDETERHAPPPRPSVQTHWVIYVALAGLVLSLLAAAVLAFGGAILSAFALLLA